MIGYQNVGMHEHASDARGLRQPVQIKPPVGVREEDRHAVIAALNDVMRLASCQQPAPSCHASLRPRIENVSGTSFEVNDSGSFLAPFFFSPSFGA
jgi:hypothetical protein